jgi:hypothetical protein
LSVESAIHAKLTGDTGPGGLVALCTNGMWQGAPPEGQPTPFLNWQMLGSRPTEYTLTQKAVDDFLAQFYAWAEDTDTAEGVETARGIIDRLETVVTDAALSVSGRALLYCRKVADLPDLVDEMPGGQKRFGKGQEWRIGVN